MPDTKRASNKTRHLLGLEKGDYYERVNTGNAGACVRNKTPFIAGKETIYGRWREGFKPGHTEKNPSEWVPDDFMPVRYTVYSYGPHFPMYIWDEETRQWYGNKDKYSVTTTRHQSAAHPRSDNIKWLDTTDMIAIDRHGVMNWMVVKAGGNPFDTQPY